VIYMTNAIESQNMQLRKVNARTHFPNDESAIKLLWFLELFTRLRVDSQDPNCAGLLVVQPKH
jgi:hypothetical protein